ncbi:hypothetical protein QE386_001841 [Pseudoxanthomonas winnipegensis]|nr:hypothetical protein [Pseudoxanthomonas winnipegensis]MDQ1133246.1 hypothetical protein [Pseudoxanthomonas winnipegensis]
MSLTRTEGVVPPEPLPMAGMVSSTASTAAWTTMTLVAVSQVAGVVGGLMHSV